MRRQLAHYYLETLQHEQAEVHYTHLIEGGDFERQSTWYLGLTGESCVRVLLLDGPPRIVIDVEH